jgi:hypothetical protein
MRMNVEPESSASRTPAPARPVQAKTTCCPRFDPSPWEDQELHWQDKPFIKHRVHCFLHIPLDIADVFETEQARITTWDAGTPEGIVLSDENSLWGADYYFAVSKDVPGAAMTRLSGTFLTHVFEGSYRSVPRWMEEMHTLAAAHGADIEKIYAWYTTCPKCAKAYGENYVVLFAKTC